MTYVAKLPNAPHAYDAQNEAQFRAFVNRALEDTFGGINNRLSSGTGFPTSILGWSHNIDFSASNNTVVAWGSGNIYLTDGTVYAIASGNTGAMTTVNYIYLDIGVSATALNISEDAQDAVGANRILVAVAQNAATGKDAQFQVFGGGDAQKLSLITADVIAADTITANEIAANTITGTEIFALDISSKTITADTGTIGGWTLSADALSSGDVTINASTERVLIGDVTGPLLPSPGKGIFLGKDGSDYEFRVGDPSGSYMHWDGANLYLTNATLNPAPVTASPSLLGWAHNLVFSALDLDTVQWGAGTVTLSDGTTYSVVAGNTGDMSAVTYIYLDSTVSSGTVLQTTTTASNASGSNKILVAVAQDAAEKDALFQVFGGPDPQKLSLLTADVVASNVITANEIASNTITANEIAANTVLASNVVIGSYDNLARNPGFEQADTGLCAEWSVVTSGGGAWSRTTSTARSGDAALEFDATSQTTADARAQNSTTAAGSNTDGIAVAEGDEFYIEGWIRSATAGTWNDAYVRIVYRSASGTYISATNGNLVAPSVTYQKSYGAGTVPAGASQAIIECFVQNDTNGGIIRFDDIYVRRKLGGSLVVDGTITGTQIDTLDLTSKTLTADTGDIGGWTLGADSLTAGTGANTVGVDSGGTNPAFYAGSATPGSAPFRVTKAGALTATNATITGAITATSGTFSGTVAAETFTGANPVFDGTLTVQSGSGNDRIKLWQNAAYGAISFYEGAAPNEAGSIWGSSSFGLVLAAKDKNIIFQGATGFGSVQSAILHNNGDVFGPKVVDGTSVGTASSTSYVTLKTVTWVGDGSFIGGTIEFGGRVTGTNNTKGVRLTIGGTSSVLFEPAAGEEPQWTVSVRIAETTTSSQMIYVSWILDDGTAGVKRFTRLVNTLTTDFVVTLDGRTVNASDEVECDMVLASSMCNDGS